MLFEAGRKNFIIVQISDLHFGDFRFDEDLLNSAISEINELKPDLLVVAGDLTTNGYKEEFEAAKTSLDQIKTKKRVIIAGNHDCRNVGYIFFEKIFGKRYADLEIKTNLKKRKKMRIVAVDSNKPDLSDGEVGRDKYKYIDKGFEKSKFNIFILHHHLVSIPGTGRERNIVWDAGDVLEKLHQNKVDLVICGHKHVPYVWKLNGMNILTSGTLCTKRTRGLSGPSYNIIEISDDEMKVRIKTPGKNETTDMVL